MDQQPDPPESLAATRRRAALAAARARGAPAIFVAVDMNNMKPFNCVFGHALGDQLLRGVEEGLGRLGEAWRVGGQEFVALVAGERAVVHPRVRDFSWLYCTRMSVTDAWAFQFEDGRPRLLVASAHLDIVCSPRIGMAELGEGGGDVEQALALAQERCRLAAIDPALHLAQDFAPIERQPWQRARRLSHPGCPLCSAATAVTESDLGTTSEHCSACGVRFEREDRMLVLGRDESAAFA